MTQTDYEILKNSNETPKTINKAPITLSIKN